MHQKGAPRAPKRAPNHENVSFSLGLKHISKSALFLKSYHLAPQRDPKVAPRAPKGSQGSRVDPPGHPKSLPRVPMVSSGIFLAPSGLPQAPWGPFWTLFWSHIGVYGVNVVRFENPAHRLFSLGPLWTLIHLSDMARRKARIR